MLVENPKVGADIEYFLTDNKTGSVTSAEGIIEGTKHEPFHFDKNEPWFMTSRDNICAEGNIPPVTDAASFVKAIQKVRRYINSKAANKNCTTIASGEVAIDAALAATEAAQEFGCDPSLDCWTMEPIKVECTSNWRYAGFHIHIGYDNPSVETNILLARAMDLYVGTPAAYSSHAKRRVAEGYGRNGNFRNQPHGCEYRSVSAEYLTNPSYLRWAFSATMVAVEAVNKGLAASLDEGIAHDIQQVFEGRAPSIYNALYKQFNLVSPGDEPRTAAPSGFRPYRPLRTITVEPVELPPVLQQRATLRDYVGDLPLPEVTNISQLAQGTAPPLTYLTTLTTLDEINLTGTESDTAPARMFEDVERLAQLAGELVALRPEDPS
jgi:hypothetical protein